MCGATIWGRWVGGRGREMRTAYAMRSPRGSHESCVGWPRVVAGFAARIFSISSDIAGRMIGCCMSQLENRNQSTRGEEGRLGVFSRLSGRRACDGAEASPFYGGAAVQGLRGCGAAGKLVAGQCQAILYTVVARSAGLDQF